MPAPVWIASPPEVHSALLSSGPGPGPLLSAAGAWNSMSVEYTSAATELTTLMGAVRAGAWQGGSAERYAAAHAPYLEWLTQAGADSAGVAAQHEVAASAYVTALATMPTLGELAANHLTHGALVATNFFGVNTIPIALNEADYARMWVQAATAMGDYHAVSGLALASAPRTTAAPPVLKTDSASAAADAPPPGSNFFTQLFNQLVQLVQNPGQVIREILTDPAALVTWFPLLFFLAYEAFFIPFGTTFWSVVLSSPAIVLPIAIGLGASYLAALGDEPPLAVPGAAGATGAGGFRPSMVMAGLASGIATPGAPVPATAAAAAAAPATPAAAASGFGYLVAGADPGTGYGPTLIERTKAQAPATRVPAAAAAVGVSARERTRARRRRQAALRDYADEFMDADTGIAPGASDGGRPAASGRGAGPLGFTGTVDRAGLAGAAGLATLTGDGFGGGPDAPMLPESWGDGGTGPVEALPETKKSVLG